MERLNVILCGAGKMGRHHLRVVQQNPAFRLRVIVDPALSGGALDGVPVVSTVGEALGDVAIVATPTATHHAVVDELIDRGIDMLVEKPLATTAAECASIATRAGARGVRVVIGHSERFNPAIRALREVELADVARVSFTRIGGGRRCDVLHELAVHDLDLLERIAGRASLRAASTYSSCDDDVIDSADLELVTARGADAFIHVDAFGERRRAIRIDARIEIDLLVPALIVDGRAAKLPTEEPLAAQLTAFREFLAGRASDVCRIDEAARSVELAAAARHRIARPHRLGQVSGTSFFRSEPACPPDFIHPRPELPGDR